MKLIGKEGRECESCKEYYYNYFFKWYSFLDKEYLCTICFKCARRELFGSKFKHNKKYYKWLKEIKE